ncbi:GIY-YIG nuclease family protein [uncultured Acetobacteroides sp.]|uniref:GIY-YIG nuclease family protein n=1 Tax=uncultured Acetobacteroides sp. TaxID=1760811 RepID=UPI0037481814
METFWVYILYSAKLDRYYIGSTGDLARRLVEHERGKTAYSRQGSPWVLKYSETYSSRSEAYCREMEMKGWKSRKRIESLIAAGTQLGSAHPA